MQRFCILLLTTSALLPLGLAIALANPQGPQVVGGSATVQGQGTPTVTVTQQTNSAIINWNTFNIGTNEKTNIIMPSSSSVQLDRVTGGQGPSQILGTLWSNGRVFLVNPDGILFGAGAKVDTAGLLATTHDITNADFMAGRYNFLIPGNPNASIVNLGTLTAQSGGFAALVAPGVRNSGTITATLGTVALASGSSFTLDFYGDRLITLGVGNSIAANVKDVATGRPLKSLVSNNGKLSANGGRVELTAAAARRVINSVINNKGVIEANSIGSKNGMIVLSAATASSKLAGSPTQTVKVSGTLSAAGTTPGTSGGTIQVTGENIAVTGATIDASGVAGGGKVLIGGDAGGGHPSPEVASIPQAQLQPYAVPTASNVTVDATTTINASSTGAGDGGKVVVWSDGTTSFNGFIMATGGALAGNGGFVETSGHVLNFAGARVDTSATNGQTGSWLLDPLSLLVDLTANSTTISTNLATTNVTLQTTVSGSSGPGTPVAGSGDILVNSGISWSSANTLTLDAYHSIAINAGITVSGTGHLVLLTNDGGSGGGLTFGPSGSASFTGPANTGQSLTINNNVYTLSYSATDVQNINSTLGGRFALAKPVDATGFANWAPIGPNFGIGFTGTFEGLGNTISNLTIAPTNSIDKLGLFGIIQAGGLVENLHLANFNIQANPNLGTGPFVGFQSIGALAGYNFGTVQNVTASGTINGGTLSGVAAGGLVGQNGFLVFPQVFGGTIQRSSSAVNITLGDGVGCSGSSCFNSRINLAGGLVGNNPGTIGNSSASGNVVVGSNSQAGGLVGVNQTPPSATTFPQPLIVNSFATGNVSSSGVNISLGGLVGYNSSSELTGHPSGLIATSYATGTVTGTAPLTANVGVDCSISGCNYENIGGLVGANSGTISSVNLTMPTASLTSCGSSWTCASGAVSVGAGGQAGGLVGYNDGIIQYAYAATGAVTGAAGLTGISSNGDSSTTLGGLAGSNQGLIQFSYAAGAVGTPGRANLQAGGLVSDNGGKIQNSYATGSVSAGDNSQAGGLTGHNGPWNGSSCFGCNPPDGAAYFNSALIINSHATGNVIVGAASLGGGLSGTSGRNSTFNNTFATGSVSGGGNSILGGFVGFTDVASTVTNSTASGAVSSSGPNSWVGGFVGVNGGTISGVYTGPVSSSSASGPVTGTSESVLGGFAGLNFGVITDSTAAITSTVNAPGANNYLGGFVGLNFGLIDPSTAAGNVSGGANNVVGGFAGANASLPGYSAGLISGSSFPAGSISNTSVASGTASGGSNSTVNPQTGTTSPTSYPASPSVIAGCGQQGLCSILANGLTLASSTESTDLLPPPPPDKWINQPDNGVKTPDLILASLTPPSGPVGSPPIGTGSYANATPGKPTFTPPPLPTRSVMGPNGETQSYIPPIGETRLVRNELIVQFGNLSDAEISNLAQSLGLQILTTETVLGRRLFTVRIPNGGDLRSVVGNLDKNPNVSAAPIYKFTLAQGAVAASKGDPSQYLLGKLQLQQAHTLATGKGVTIALIDSQVDKRHMELDGNISDELDTVGVDEPLQSHGTEMAGAIVSHNRLLGVAPDAKILAVRAFGQSSSTREATTLSILKGLEWAESQNARIINMSFAGPRDPLLERAFKAAHDKGIVLIAAAGNAGPKSPPLYPAADPNVIAVTATDVNNRLFSGANQGPQLSVSAPGVDIIAPGPDGGYQMSTGTSIATAHVSGVVALMLERDPTLKPDNVRKILEATATGLGPVGKNGQFGWGLVNPPKALEAVIAELKPSESSSKPR